MRDCRDMSILEITIKLGKKGYAYNLNNELGIDQNNLNNELSQQPSKFAWFAVLSTLAEDIFKAKKSELKVAMANMDRKVREAPHRFGVDKLTETSVEKAIERSSLIINLNEEVRKTKLNSELLYAAVEAFRQRKDSLISIASNFRAERDRDLKILKRDAADVVRKGGKSRG